MASAKKKTTKARRPASAGKSQVEQLRATVKELRAKLERETKSRKLDSRLLAEAKRARDEVARQVTALRDQGRKLATQLKATLSDANRREKARKEAMAKINELRAELGRKTEEVRRKSEELKKLAIESAERARDIITGETAAPPSVTKTPMEGKPEGKEESGI